MNQEFHYYPFAVELDRSTWNCDTINDLSIEALFQIKRKT